MYSLKTMFKSDITFPITPWTLRPVRMPSQPELPAPRPQPPVSRVEKMVTSRHEQQQQQQQQQCVASGATRIPVILTTDSVMKKLPVSLSCSLSNTNVVHSITTTHSDSTTNLVVVSTSTQNQSADNKNVYKLSEVVMKEKDSLFNVSGESEDSMYILEPPRSDVLTVRMRSKNFFTLMEEDEDGDIEKKPATAAADGERYIPKYTPVFNVGQNLHKIFNTNRHHKHRKGHTVAISSDSTDSTGQEKHEVAMHTAPQTSDSEVQEGNFVELYEKISINSSLRRITSQPSLEKCSMDDFIQSELGRGFGLSQSTPTTPQVSPRLIRRNSLNSMDKPKLGDTLKPESAGPGYSFLASVAGELISKKKKEPGSNSNVKPDKAVVDLRPDGMAIKERHPSNADNEESDTESLSQSPKRSDIMAEMKANALQKQGETKKKSFIKSFVEWGTTANASVANKETNMFSPTSY